MSDSSTLTLNKMGCTNSSHHSRELDYLFSNELISTLPGDADFVTKSETYNQ